MPPLRPSAAQADVAIVFATQWAAESVDLPDMQLPDNQDALISAVAKANPKTVLVLEPMARCARRGWRRCRRCCRRLLAPSTRTTALPGLVANRASLPSGATTGTSARRG